MCEETGTGELEYIGTTEFDVLTINFLTGGCEENQPHNQQYSSLYQSFWSNFLNWEQDDLNFVIKKGEQDKIFIDIGAWIGPYTLIAASMGMKVYAFEPEWHFKN